MKFARNEGSRAERWAGVSPSLFVVASLIALLVVPIFVEWRVDKLRNRIEGVAEPARMLVAEVHYLLAGETLDLRSYLLTGDTTYLARYRASEEREVVIYPELERLAAEISPELLAQAVELRSLSRERRERVAAVVDAGPITTGLQLDQALALDLAGRLNDAAFEVENALRGSTVAFREQIRGIESISRVVYVLLLGVTFAATIAVGNLNFRIGRLVRESNARREEAEAALDRSERLAVARADLIRGFTHDVKNPLGAADGYAQLLEAGVRGAMTPQQVETVSAIRGSIHGAIHIIEDLLDLSRLESGGLQIARGPVSCLDLAREVVLDHSAAAATAGIELTAGESPTGEAGELFSDAVRIRQVLDNLVSNAIKYTPAHGRVVVSVSRDSTEEPPRPGTWIAVSVSDTGPGIPSEELDRIFHEFHRVPGSRGQGHGLGLAIGRRVARLLGGDVTVRSTLGEGATFILWLPVRADIADGESAPVRAEP